MLLPSMRDLTVSFRFIRPSSDKTRLIIIIRNKLFILGGGLKGRGGYRKRKEDKSENGIKILSTDKVILF